MSKLEEACRKFLGLAPFNVPTNIVRNDSWFYLSLCKQYGEYEVNHELARLEREG